PRVSPRSCGRHAPPTRGGQHVAVAESMQCPGCRQAIDLRRPPDMQVKVVKEAESGRHSAAIVILIGRVEVHRCVQCTDGRYR
ncbi:MAG: hypothetical protein WD598_03535, partial [Acidimicrobiia bacterium]